MDKSNASAYSSALLADGPEVIPKGDGIDKRGGQLAANHGLPLPAEVRGVASSTRLYRSLPTWCRAAASSGWNSVNSVS
jgi:hypothetical protein